MTLLPFLVNQKAAISVKVKISDVSKPIPTEIKLLPMIGIQVEIVEGESPAAWASTLADGPVLLLILNRWQRFQKRVLQGPMR
mmetsp:Transcript_10027/g.12338  ORF Transcript_10027/g.12338 Transcript_10027/m.12338 type:complete len:83 (+) Transcript_10027:195-443(+)